MTSTTEHKQKEEEATRHCNINRSINGASVHKEDDKTSEDASVQCPLLRPDAISGSGMENVDPSYTIFTTM